ncbi:MAG: enoyl-CoA hydratase/isomerase family protein [Steroidobacteraceae bacterium]
MTDEADAGGFESLEYECRDGVATLWLNRPEVRNAFDERLVAAIAAGVRRAGADPEVRVVVLAGRGSVFCAGADLRWMQRMAGFSREQNHADALALANMLRALQTCPKPTIARVHGDCYAGGLGLVAACDVAVAASGVHFCLTEVRIGLVPATIGPYVLRAIGARAASRYMLTAERFDATEAARLGLVHTVVDAAELDAEVTRYAGALRAGGPAALAAAKQLIDDLTAAAIDEHLVEDTAARIAALRASPEGREGVQSVLGRRAPAWRGDREA